MFERACLDGQARLAEGSAAPIEFEALPRQLRDRLKTPTSGQVVRLTGDGAAFLYLLNYDGDPERSPRVCGVASDQLSYATATNALQMHLTGQKNSAGMPTNEWISLQNGYRAFATRAGKFKVMQIDWLSDAQRAAAEQELKSLRH